MFLTNTDGGRVLSRTSYAGRPHERGRIYILEANKTKCFLFTYTAICTACRIQHSSRMLSEGSWARADLPETHISADDGATAVENRYVKRIPFTVMMDVNK